MAKKYTLGWFHRLMDQRMQLGKDKVQYTDLEIGYLIKRLKENLHRLEVVDPKNLQLSVDSAADVANYAGMIADKLTPGGKV